MTVDDLSSKCGCSQLYAIVDDFILFYQTLPKIFLGGTFSHNLGVNTQSTVA